LCILNSFICSSFVHSFIILSIVATSLSSGMYIFAFFLRTPSLLEAEVLVVVVDEVDGEAMGSMSNLDLVEKSEVEA